MTDGVGRVFEPSAVPGFGGAVRAGGRFAVASSVVQQLASVGSTLVLVRLLASGELGVVAAANVVLGLFTVALQVGVGFSVLRRRAVDDGVASTLFWTGLGVGVAGSVAMATSAPWLATAFGLGGRSGYVVLLAPALLLSFANAVPRALLLRRLEFRRLAAIDVTTAVLYSTLQVSLATAGLGAAAVLIAQVAAAAVAVALTFLALKWLPSRRFDRRVVREESRFQVGVVANMILAWVNKNADYWVVVHAFGLRRLGMYYVAYVVPTILRQRVNWAASTVLMPVFARITHDDARLRAAYLSSLRVVVGAGMPMMVGLALVAPEAIAVFFGPEWADAASPMRLVAVAAGIELATQVATTLFIADGRSHWSASTEAVRLVVFTVGLVAAARVGSLTAIGWAVVAMASTGAVVAHTLAGRRLAMPVAQLWSCLAPVLIATGSMAAAVVAVDAAVDLEARWSLVVLVGVGVSAFVITGFGLFRGAFSELRSEVVALFGGSRPSEQLDVAQRQVPGVR